MSMQSMKRGRRTVGEAAVPSEKGGESGRPCDKELWADDGLFIRVEQRLVKGRYELDRGWEGADARPIFFSVAASVDDECDTTVWNHCAGSADDFLWEVSGISNIVCKVRSLLYLLV